METAYTTLQTALEEATNSNTNWLIHIAPGHYIETDATPTYSDNITLSAVDPHSVIITNSVYATHVLKFTGLVFLKNICVTCAGSQNGIIIETTEHGGLLDTVHIDTTAVTGAQYGIMLDGGGSFVTIINCLIQGNVAYTHAIHVEDWGRSEIWNIRIGTCLVGIHIMAGNAWFIHGPVNFNFCDTCIQIDSGVTSTRIMQVFYNHTVTINVIDDGTNTVVSRGLQHIDREIVKIFPIATNTGPEVTTGAANAWGNYAEIDDGASFTSYIKIISIFIANPSDANDEYFVELAIGAAGSEITLAQTGFTGGTARTNVGATLKTGWISAGTRISARGMSVSGADTFNVWIEYVNINP